jgi:hypothetical protein
MAVDELRTKAVDELRKMIELHERSMRQGQRNKQRAQRIEKQTKVVKCFEGRTPTVNGKYLLTEKDLTKCKQHCYL